jgi:hypothetical protein
MVGEGLPKYGWAERLANGVLASADASPPVDLYRLADHLGVGAVRLARMREDGRTTWLEGRPVIELRDDRPPARTRFTFAHELAHVVLEDNRNGPARRTFSISPERVESLCDWIAAALLMPRPWVAPYAARDALNLSVVRLVASKADVSLAAAAVRIAEVGRRTCALLRWKDVGSRWVLASRAGLPKEIGGYLELAEPPPALIRALVQRRDHWQEVLLLADGIPFRARAQLDRAGSTCLMLLTEISPLGLG